MLSHETSPLRDPNDFTFIDPANGQRLAYPGNTDLWKWTNIPGFNKSKFAWTSSQTLDANYPPQRAGAVELQLDRDGNTYAELAASQSGTAIYQKIATTPGVAYTVRLSHASQSAATGMDRLQVLIGPPRSRTIGTPNPGTRKPTTPGNGNHTRARTSRPARSLGSRSGTWIRRPTTTATCSTTSSSPRRTRSLTTGTGTRMETPRKTSRKETAMKTSTPPRWYKRAIAMIAGLGLVAPLTACGQTDTGANAVSQPQAYSIAAKTLPDHIVNGDFEYPSIAGHATGKIMDGYAWWAYILPDEGASQTDQRKAPKTITEFDANRFGWKSLTLAVNGFHAGTVELQRDVKGDTPGMQFAEIVSELGEYAIYQDVSVQPGEHLSWSLKHAPRGYTGQRNADQMQVLIGPPGHETVSPATRVTSNGTGRIGETDTTITTHATADRRFHPWETYTGTYLVPDGVTVVRFTFRALTYGDTSGSKTRSGNLVDDISFGATYPLTYDGNGNTDGNTPQRK